MNKYYLLLLVIISQLFIACVKEIKNNDIKGKKVDFALVIHGGAGYIYPGRYTDEEEQKYKDILEASINYGYEILEKDGSAIDAVETVIRVLEDSPLFNAGRGAVLNSDGDVELDASIMDGKNLNAGGVAGVRHIKNPITLARFVMEHSPHVLLFGEGAEKFADEFGLQKVDNDFFKTDKTENEFHKISKFGTVGCVAIDKNGNLAAGTSTGGIMGKKFGRVGDSPIIGAGTYADNMTCAISATGQGEFFIRNVVAHEISSLIKHKGISISESANFVINNKLKEQKALGGIIGIDKYGNITMTFNTQGMFRGFRKSNEGPNVMLY